MRKPLLLLCFLSVYVYVFAQSDTTAILLRDVQIEAVQEKKFPGTTKVLYKYAAKEIQKEAVLSVDAFLKNVPGIDVRQRSIGGTQADISMRGGSFDQVMILLNGINITDQQTGHHNLNIPIDLDDVERIEVLMGSAARRYGNQAFSGAINFITNPKSEDMVKTSLSYGSYRSFNQKAAIALKKKSWQSFTSFTHDKSRGYRDNTDYDNYNVFSHTAYETKQNGKFDLQLGYQRKSFGAAGFYSLAYPDQFEHTKTHFAALGWQKTINKFYLSADAYYRSHYDRFELFRGFKNAADWYTDHNYHLTGIKAAQFDMTYLSDFGKIAAGASLRYDHIYSTVLGDALRNGGTYKNRFEKRKSFDKEADRLVQTAYADYTKALGNLYFSAGTSLSHSRQFGLQTHWGTDISYLLMPHFTVFAAVNTASRLPTFTDLYYESATQTANPNLKAETAISFDIGTKYDLDPWMLQANFFHRKGQHIIDWIKYPDEDKWKSMNLTSLNTSGLSLYSQYSFKESILKNVSFAYSFIYADKEAADYDSKYALDYLRHQIIFKLQHQLFKNTVVAWNFSLNDRAGEYADFDTGTLKPYQAYLLADCRIAYAKRKFTFYIDVNNLLHQYYVDYGGLPMPRIHGLLGVKWNFKK